MPPRRSAAASSAKRAAEDLTDEADDAKRHKADSAPIAAVAAPAAAATPANPSSAGAAASGASSSSSQRGDATLAAAAAAVPLPESLDCPICDESFPAEECKEEGGAGRVPRSLFCSPKPHTYCTKCLERMVQHGVDDKGNPRTFVPCSLCRYEHVLHSQQPPASSAAAAGVAAGPTNAELVCFIPINASLMESIGHRRQLERIVRETQEQLQSRSTMRCTFPDCGQPALIWCDECEGELCAAHDRDLHPATVAAAATSAAHRRIPLSERAAVRQAKMTARLAANGARLRAFVHSLEKETTKRVSVITGQLETEIARHQREVLAPLQARLAALKAAQVAVSALAGEVAPLSDTELLKHEVRINDLAKSDVLRGGLLAELSAERRSDLERFLQMVGVSLEGTHGLLYRGSRDGFKRDDFVRCCAKQGPTLTLVKVAGSGFIFGAYTHCSWPSVKGTVADPTGKSFLFSLVNVSGKAVRFNLRDKDRAIQLANCISFGADKWEGDKQTGFPNFILMRQGQVADQKDANAANPSKHDDAFGSYQSDDGAAHDQFFFAGQKHFAATEIEVYQL